MEPNVCFLIFFLNNYLTICFCELKAEISKPRAPFGQCPWPLSWPCFRAKRFELQACLLLSFSWSGLDRGPSATSATLQALWGWLAFEAEAGLSVPQVCVGHASLPWPAGLWDSAWALNAQEKPQAAPRTLVLPAVFSAPPSCPVSAIMEPWFWGEISVKKMESHFYIICEVVKKPLSWVLHWLLEHFRNNKGIFLISKKIKINKIWIAEKCGCWYLTT